MNKLLILIVVVVILFVLLNNTNENTNNKEISEKKEPQMPNKESFENNVQPAKIDTNKCSRDCCGLAQWPVPSELLSNNISSEELKNYIPSNFSCNLGANSGCVCLTQNDYNYLSNHGTP
jgi:hypothetical protein